MLQLHNIFITSLPKLQPNQPLYIQKNNAIIIKFPPNKPKQNPIPKTKEHNISKTITINNTINNK